MKTGDEITGDMFNGRSIAAQREAEAFALHLASLAGRPPEPEAGKTRVHESDTGRTLLWTGSEWVDDEHQEQA